MVFRIGQNTLTNKFGSKRTAQIEFLVQKSIVFIENIWSLKCFGSKRMWPKSSSKKIWLKKSYLKSIMSYCQAQFQLVS